MSLELIVGPMFSGKSTEIRRRVKRAQAVGHKVLVIKHDKDVRYSDKPEVTTHDQLTVHAELASRLLPMLEHAICHKLVVIEEVQFFEDVEDVRQFVHRLIWAGREVVAVGLDGDFNREPWPVVSALTPLAHKSQKLLAICMRCKKNDAPYTCYKGPPTGSVNPGVHGYEACCAECWTPPEFRSD